MSRFGGYAFVTLGFINVNLTAGPLQVATTFYVNDAHVACQLLLGRSWIHKHNAVPSMYHQYLKAIWKDKKVHINAYAYHFW